LQQQKWQKAQQTVENGIYTKLGQDLMLDLIVSQTLEGSVDQNISW
jgi:hypothetical protein